MQSAKTLLDPDDQQTQPEFMIQFGSKHVQAAISDARFATCLTEDVRQSLQVNMSFSHCDVSLYNVFIFFVHYYDIIIQI